MKFNKEKLKMKAKWWKAASLRALKTTLQTASAQLLVIPLTGGYDNVRWMVIVLIAGIAGAVSMITSLQGLPEVKLEEKVEQLEEEVSIMAETIAQSSKED